MKTLKQTLVTLLCLILTCSMTVSAASVSELEEKLESKVTKLEKTKDKIDEKTKDIIAIEAELKSAKAEEEKKLEDMKNRIVFMYEHMTADNIFAIIATDSYTHTLNKAYMISTLMEYDREQLEKCQKFIEETKEKEKKLKIEKAELKKMKKQQIFDIAKLKKEIKEQKIKNEQMKKRVSNAGQVNVTYKTANNYGYSDQQLDLICAIVAQECSTSYEGALAVMTCAMNRCESSKWRYLGRDPLSQLCARGQFCYSIDNHWRKRLNGNYAGFVKQAVIDGLNGKRNHNYLSFRGYQKPGSVCIGDNYYFSAM